MSKFILLDMQISHGHKIILYNLNAFSDPHLAMATLYRCLVFYHVMAVVSAKFLSRVLHIY